MNICLLGLSGSGKTCYLYTATHVLSKGINVNGHKVSISASHRQQMARLNIGIEQMAKGYWPEGSMSTMSYPFEFKIDGLTLGSFNIYDYRGSMLIGTSDDDQDDTEELFETFDQSNCIIILVDGDTVMEALDPNDVSPEHRKNSSFASQLSARNRLNFIEVLIKEAKEQINKNIPILLAITKRDIFNSAELRKGIDLLKELLPWVFSQRNDVIVGITAVTLGENLTNDKGKLRGTLCLNTEGNVHLPILFALFQEDIHDDECYEVMKSIFSSNKIELYRGGKPAYII